MGFARLVWRGCVLPGAMERDAQSPAANGQDAGAGVDAMHMLAMINAKLHSNCLTAASLGSLRAELASHLDLAVCGLDHCRDRATEFTERPRLRPSTFCQNWSLWWTTGRASRSIWWH